MFGNKCVTDEEKISGLEKKKFFNRLSPASFYNIHLIYLGGSIVGLLKDSSFDAELQSGGLMRETAH